MDLATPVLAALLWLGGLPPAPVAALGLLTAFAGYTAVYALNDVVDYRADKEKLRQERAGQETAYLDAVFVRHPLAHGLVSLKEGIFWTGAWALVALLGAWRLNPVCALIFLLGALLETAYCLMLGVSHLRSLVSGVVKTLGGLAAVFAVAPNPSPLFLAALFLWLFFWEIGGQNIPADWHDLEADRQLAARTIPVRFGARKASALVLACLSLSLLLSLPLARLAPAGLSWLHAVLVAAAGLYLLILPAWRLYRLPTPTLAARLFNQASYYPLAVLAVVLLSLVA